MYIMRSTQQGPDMRETLENELRQHRVVCSLLGQFDHTPGAATTDAGDGRTGGGPAVRVPGHLPALDAGPETQSDRGAADGHPGRVRPLDWLGRLGGPQRLPVPTGLHQGRHPTGTHLLDSLSGGAASELPAATGCAEGGPRDGREGSGRAPAGPGPSLTQGTPEGRPNGAAPKLVLGTLKNTDPQTQEPGDGDAEGTPGNEHLDNPLGSRTDSGWFGVADPVAEVLANPWRLFDLIGALFEVVTPDAGLPIGTRGRVLDLWTNPEALWVHVQLLPPATLPTPPGCLGLASRRAYKDDFAVPFFLRTTRPWRLAPCG